jgi:hypothetical protein
VLQTEIVNVSTAVLIRSGHDKAEWQRLQALPDLKVLGLLVDLEPQAADLLECVCAGPLVTQAELQAAGAFFPEGFVSATAPAQSTLDM